MSLFAMVSGDASKLSNSDVVVGKAARYFKFLVNNLVTIAVIFRNSLPPESYRKIVDVLVLALGQAQHLQLNRHVPGPSRDQVYPLLLSQVPHCLALLRMRVRWRI